MAKKTKKKAKQAAPGPSDVVIAWIRETGIVDVVKDHSNKTQVHLLCRVHHKKLWVALMEYVLVRRKQFTEHLCQQYFVRGGRLVYGWTLILDPADSVTAMAEEFAKLMKQAIKVVPKTVMKGQLSSFPLIGGGAYRTSQPVFDPRMPGPSRGGPSHKGAYNVRAEE